VASWWRSSLVSGVVCCSREMDDEVFMTRSLNVTPKTTEQNLIVRIDKSETKVTSNTRLRSTDRECRAVTAALLVVIKVCMRLTKQPKLTAIIQSRRLTVWRYAIVSCMPETTTTAWRIVLSYVVNRYLVQCLRDVYGFVVEASSTSSCCVLMPFQRSCPFISWLC